MFICILPLLVQTEAWLPTPPQLHGWTRTVGGPPGANVTPASPLHSLTRATAGTNWTQTIRWLDFPVITGRRWGSLLAVVRVYYTNYDSVLIIPTAEAELWNDGVKWRPRLICSRYYRTALNAVNAFYKQIYIDRYCHICSCSNRK